MKEYRTIKNDSNSDSININNSINCYNLSLYKHRNKSYFNLPKIKSTPNIKQQGTSMPRARNIKSNLKQSNIKDYNTIDTSEKKIRTKLMKDFFGSKSSNQLFNDSDNIGYIFNTKIKVPNLKRFHCQLMKQNEEKQKKKVTDIFNIIYNKPKQEENKIEIVDKEFTGKQSLNEYLKLIREDMKFNKAYHKKSLKDDVKILLKNELNNAKKKLKIEKNEPIKNLNEKPIWLKKLERYNCLSYQNPLLQVNKLGNVESLVKDGELMYQLFQDGFELCNNKRYQIHY